jgi:hypothetical protein
MTASLARPFSGGAFTFTLSESPSQPTISSRDDPGTTLRLSLPKGVALKLSVVSWLGLDDIRRVADLFLEFLHECLVVNVDGAAGEIQQVLG